MALYNETVMEHFMNPHNVGEIENADGEGIYGGIFADSCTIDNLHPNDAGFMRMAEKIGEPLIRALGAEFNV